MCDNAASMQEEWSERSPVLEDGKFLSRVGLLYLRPLSSGPFAIPLLVPPLSNGTRRREMWAEGM